MIEELFVLNYQGEIIVYTIKGRIVWGKCRYYLDIGLEHLLARRESTTLNSNEGLDKWLK